jgi:hypothetical protein
MKKLLPILILLFVLFTSMDAIGQSLIYTFVDPCTNEVTYFSIPVQGGTTIIFLGKQRTFTADDLSSGVFSSWLNDSYSEYRQVTPCSVQSTNIIRNQITAQIIGSTVQSVVGSIMSQATSVASTPIPTTSSSSSSGSSSSSPKTTKGTNSNSSSEGGSSEGGSTSETKGEEVAATTTMNVDAQNDKGSDNSSSGGGGSKKSGGNGGGRSNPVIVSSDLTSAQNLDKSFTGIINVGMSQSSLTGSSSWGVTSMIWLNFKQYALSGRYTKIQYNKSGTLKLIHNVNLTSVYSYGNVLGFLGYSTILNAGKWGVTGANLSGAVTKSSEDNNLFLSPSLTAFYTKPLKINDRLVISPEIYIISTPLVYSSVEKVTVTDRTFSGFLGAGFDYQITKRFKVNVNYKANVSTNSELPILSFFLIGSKINL